MQVTPQPPARLLTIRDASRALGVKVHQLRYMLDNSDIEPRQRAGLIRLFSRDQLPTMASALRRVAGRRTNG